MTKQSKFMIGTKKKMNRTNITKIDLVFTAVSI